MENLRSEETGAQIKALREQYENYKSRGLKLDMSRGKPCKEQLDLSEGLLSDVVKNDDCAVSYTHLAPTGRAAKRVPELTRKEAKTIHRLLEYQQYEGEFVFMRNKDRPLEYDAVILDESSMIDMLLFLQLLEALPEASRLIMVGDINQLPPVLSLIHLSGTSGTSSTGKDVISLATY